MAAAFTAAIMASSAAGSKQRTALSSTLSRSLGPGRGLPGAVAAVAQRHDVAEDRDAELGEQQLGQGAGGDAGRRLAGRGPFEHVAGVFEAVLQHPGQVGVTRPGLGQDLRRHTGLGRHLLGPLGPLGVGDLDGHRRAERAAVADPAEQGDLVGLEAHARAAAEAEPAPGQLVGDVRRLDGQAGRQPLDDHDQGATVGFTGGQKAQHTATLPDGRRHP